MPLTVTYKEIIIAIIFTLVTLKFFLYALSNENLRNSPPLQVYRSSDFKYEPEKHDLHFKDSQNNDENQSKTKDGSIPSMDGNLNISAEDLISGDAIPLSQIENDLLYRPPLDIALIFTKAGDNKALQYNLKRAVSSLLEHTHTPIRLHILSDEESFSIGLAIIKKFQETNQLNSGHIKIVYVSATDVVKDVEPTLKLLQNYFTQKSSSQYRDFLFFFSLFVDRLLPGITRVILMDIDIHVLGDIAELYSYFSRFSDTQIMGLSPELSPVYHHILSKYRSQHPNTTYGYPIKSGGFPGYNSGVMLINIPKLRNSSVIKSYLTAKTLDEKTKKYNFRGHLGDQDLYTLIALDHPQLFYTLPCVWNRHLCQWWNIQLYKDVFDQFFECLGEIKLLHGNCKSHIPS